MEQAWNMVKQQLRRYGNILKKDECITKLKTLKQGTTTIAGPLSLSPCLPMWGKVCNV